MKLKKIKSPVEVGNTTQIEEEYVYLRELTHQADSLIPKINRRMKLVWLAYIISPPSSNPGCDSISNRKPNAFYK